MVRYRQSLLSLPEYVPMCFENAYLSARILRSIPDSGYLPLFCRLVVQGLLY